MRHKFKATTQRLHSKRTFGFDIETHSDNKGFLLCSLVGLDIARNPYKKMFFTKEDFIKEIKVNPIFRGAEIYATNLSFDFFGTLYDQSDLGNFVKCERGSALLSVKTWFEGSGEATKFVPSSKRAGKSGNRRKSLEFIDTLNYAKMSVEQMGKQLGFPKMKSPVFGKPWKQMTKEEQDYMIEYNFRDSEVTYKFANFLIDAFESLGASVNLTIGSTSMSLFKNKYLGDFEVHPVAENILRRLFLGFYGGRTETFMRGEFSDMNYYDFNSLYPSVMQLEEFPDPNSMRVSKVDTTNYIMHCEGVSEVEVEVPYMKIPPLPYRDDKGRIMFLCGRMRSSWSHIELRNAVECGCKITKVYESIYYVRNMRPFVQYVKDLYDLRDKYKAEDSPMEKVVKLFMNNLFGKFGEKFDDKGYTVHKNAITEKQVADATRIEEYADGKHFKVTENQDPKAHCIPIWAIYVSAYGRVKLHQFLVKYGAVYCDTDSLITPHEIDTSTDIGRLKLEMSVAKGCCIRPKMYALYSKEDKDHIKLKGLAQKYQPKTYDKFRNEFVKDPKIMYHKFTKFKEAIRSKDLVPNEVQLTYKNFGLEDNKRDWGDKKFNVDELQDSEPLWIFNGVIRKRPKNDLDFGREENGETSQGRKLKRQKETNDK